MVFHDHEHSERAQIRVLGLEPGKKPVAPPTGRKYTVEVYDPLRAPTRKYYSLRTRDPRLALKRFIEFERRYRSGEIDLWDKAKGAPPAGKPLTCAAAVGAYLAHLLTAQSESGLPVRPSTLRQRRTYLGRFVRWVDEHAYPGALVTDVTADHVRSFAFGRGLEPGSITTQLNVVKRFLQWAVDGGHLRRDPAAALKGPRSEERVTFFKDAQLAALVASIRERIQANGRGMKRFPALLPTLLDAVIVAAGTGMRLGEVCHLRWEHVDLDGRVVHVVDSKAFRTKNGRSRTIPLAGEALAVLVARRAAAEPGAVYVFPGDGGGPPPGGDGGLSPGDEGGPSRGKYLSAKLKEFVRACGLPDELTFHSLRHTFATRLARAGVPEYRIQCLLGHSCNRMTQRYMHQAGVDTRSAMERVFGTQP